MCKKLCETLADVFRLIDDIIAKERPKGLKIKGKREVTQPMIFGNVKLERRLYEDTTSSDKRYRFLLDEVIGLPGGGQPSPNLLELAIHLITEESFRETSKVLDKLGIEISHQTIHQWKEKLGEERKQEQENKEQKATTDKIKDETKILFAESDAVHVSLQREKKKNIGIKVGLIHEGWELQNPARKEKSLVNKEYYAAIQSSDTFWEQMQLMVMDRCDIEKTPVVINTDGDAGLTKGVEYFNKGISQLDRFHWSKELRQLKVKDKKGYLKIKKAIEQADSDTMNKEFARLLSAKLSWKEKEETQKLCNYLNRHWQSLRSYYKRDETYLEGIEKDLYDLGAIESAGFRVIAHRMKGRALAWTIDGADRMARLLSLKANKQLDEWLEKPGRLWGIENRSPEVFERAKRHIKQNTGSGYEPKQAKLGPMDGPSKSGFRRFLRNILDDNRVL